jgi:hypothetical protein
MLLNEWMTAVATCEHWRPYQAERRALVDEAGFEAACAMYRSRRADSILLTPSTRHADLALWIAGKGMRAFVRLRSIIHRRQALARIAETEELARLGLLR